MDTESYSSDIEAKEAYNKVQEYQFIPCKNSYPLIRKGMWNRGSKNGTVRDEIRNLSKILLSSGNKNFCRRKEEVVINRLRFGHTRITHRFMFENDVMPMCCFF